MKHKVLVLVAADESVAVWTVVVRVLTTIHTVGYTSTGPATRNRKIVVIT